MPGRNIGADNAEQLKGGMEFMKINEFKKMKAMSDEEFFKFFLPNIYGIGLEEDYLNELHRRLTENDKGNSQDTGKSIHESILELPENY